MVATPLVNVCLINCLGLNKQLNFFLKYVESIALPNYIYSSVDFIFGFYEYIAGVYSYIYNKSSLGLLGTSGLISIFLYWIDI
ncbi:MAG: hypothetical protein CM15mP83_0560 [Flavobacteriaceae bacterium]|nr:MAG: hypothetical protein CM15mP83_0560 [Flavobacteriaceae bacterium]